VTESSHRPSETRRARGGVGEAGVVALYQDERYAARRSPTCAPRPVVCLPTGRTRTPWRRACSCATAARMRRWPSCGTPLPTVPGRHVSCSRTTTTSRAPGALPGFSDLVAAAERRCHDAPRSTLDTVVAGSVETATALLVALHGAGSYGPRTAPTWRPLATDGVILLAPTSWQRTSPTQRSWQDPTMQMV
jgi:hypothetical protein